MAKKVLCICNHGNVRSVGLAYAFKSLSGDCLKTDEEYLNKYIVYEAISMGAHSSTYETLKYFIDWADIVIDLSDEPNRKQVVKVLAKSKYFDGYPIIGYDFYGNPKHPDLQARCLKIVEIIEKSNAKSI